MASGLGLTGSCRARPWPAAMHWLRSPLSAIRYGKDGEDSEAEMSKGQPVTNSCVSEIVEVCCVLGAREVRVTRCRSVTGKMDNPGTIVMALGPIFAQTGLRKDLARIVGKTIFYRQGKGQVPRRLAGNLVLNSRTSA